MPGERELSRHLNELLTFKHGRDWRTMYNCRTDQSYLIQHARDFTKLMHSDYTGEHMYTSPKACFYMKYVINYKQVQRHKSDIIKVIVCHTWWAIYIYIRSELYLCIILLIELILGSIKNKTRWI